VTSNIKNMTETPGQVIARHQRHAPVDVVRIAEELGINVWEMEQMSPDVSGKLCLDPLNGGDSGFSIVVRKADLPARKRFTVAHELAHFVLHRRQFGNGVTDDALYRSGLTNRQEAEANRLAAEILMPYPLIESLMKRGFRTASALAEQLRVSKTAIGIRLGLPNVD
jgi:hypothetical protein